MGPQEFKSRADKFDDFPVSHPKLKVYERSVDFADVIKSGKGNPTVSEDFIKAELAKDSSSATAEYLAQFREDISTFLAREAIEACAVLPGDLSPKQNKV